MPLEQGVAVVQSMSRRYPLSDWLPADEVIVISDDDDPMGNDTPSSLGGFDGTLVAVSGPPLPVGNHRWWEISDESLSLVHTECDVNEMFHGTSYGPIQYSPEAYSVIVQFLNQVMADPVDADIDPTMEQLYRCLRNSLRDLSGGLRRGDRKGTTGLLGPDWKFMATSHFGLSNIRTVD